MSDENYQKIMEFLWHKDGNTKVVNQDDEGSGEFIKNKGEDLEGECPEELSYPNPPWYLVTWKKLALFAFFIIMGSDLIATAEKKGFFFDKIHQKITSDIQTDFGGFKGVKHGHAYGLLVFLILLGIGAFIYYKANQTLESEVKFEKEENSKAEEENSKAEEVQEVGQNLGDGTFSATNPETGENEGPENLPTSYSMNPLG